MLPMKRVYQRKKPMSVNTYPTLQTRDFFTLPARPRRSRLGPTLSLWNARRQTRRQLATLDDRGLADVGLSRSQQRIECAKSFWQL